MLNFLKPAALLLRAALCVSAEESLNHYGLASIPDKPVFLIGDLRHGVGIGDIIRIKD